MKSLLRYFLCPLFIIPISLFGQKHIADSIYIEFEKCLSGYFKQEYKGADTSNIYFYGNKLNPFMELQAIDLGSGKYFSKTYKDALDSAHRNDTSYHPFFYRGMSFDEFINYIMAQPSVDNCILRKEKGVWVFVDCSDENWQHFFFDRLVYKDGCYVTPIVDIFNSDGDLIKHSRYIFVCYFTKKKGFKVAKKYLIRENTICN